MTKGEQFFAINQWWTVLSVDESADRARLHYSDGFRSQHLYLPVGVARTLVSTLKATEAHRVDPD